MEKVKAVVHAKALKQYIALRILLIFLHNLQFHLFFLSLTTHTQLHGNVSWLQGMRASYIFCLMITVILTTLWNFRLCVPVFLLHFFLPNITKHILNRPC